MNYNITKILVAVDMSDTSLNALDAAVAIAKKHHATIQVLNIIERSLYANGENRFLSEINKSNSDVLTALTKSISSSGKVASQFIQLEGDVVDSIIKFSQSEQCDLIVVGTHGASGFREGFIGSKSYDVIKFARCPVLTIPPKRKFNLFEKVLFPIRPVSGALKRYNVVCHFLSASAKLEVLGLSYLNIERNTGIIDKIVEGIRDQLNSDKVDVHTSWGKSGYVTDDILDYAIQSKPDLIILTSAIDAISKPHFIGPHAQKIINRATVPVLSIKEYGMLVFS
ncbi:MAG: universal stress protein [Ferruginibacter sp.]